MTDGGSSIPEVHALLATLVASKPAGRFAETGTARWQRRSCPIPARRSFTVTGSTSAFQDIADQRPSSVCLLNNAATIAPIGVIGQLAAAEVATARQAAEPLPSYANGPTI